MKKQVKTSILWLAIALFMVSCRAGDCGCPMTEEVKQFESAPSDTSLVNLGESHPRDYRKSDTW